MGSGGVRPSGTVTFLFTDVEGSTKRWEADPDAVCTTQPQRVVEVPVDALRVVASPVQHFEVRITRRDLADVLRPIELALRILRVRMQPHRHHSPTQTVGQSVVVVPTERASLVDVAMRSDPVERHEHRLARLGHLTQPDPTTLRNQPHLLDTV